MKPEFLHQGKVRDIYAWGNDLLLVASDRISAFDVVLPTPIPGKGIALTQLSKFWFEKFNDQINHHVISFNLPKGLKKPEWKNRVTHCRKASVIPIECVVRGYLAGAGWADYQKTGMVQERQVPSGLVLGSKLPEPLFTPTTKAASGHDQPLSPKAGRELIGVDLYEELKEKSLRIYKFARDYAHLKGTKRLFMEAGYQVKTIPLFERKLYMSTIVREKMLKDDSWIYLVPKSVADFILEIDGVNRLRDLTRTDRGC